MARLAGLEHGVLSLLELRLCGLSERQVDARVARGRLHPLHRGVYAVGHTDLGLVSLFAAAVKACGPGAVLSHLAAAALWDFFEWDERSIEVTVPSPLRRRHRGLRVHRSATLAASDITHHLRVPVTTPTRTVLDSAAVLGERPLRRVVRRALAKRRTSLPQIAKQLNRLGPRRGSRRLANVIATGYAPTRSEMEDVVLDLLLSANIEHPEVNEPMWLEGRKVIPDFRWPAQRLVLEADSAEWHDDPLSRADDAERQALLEAHGERVLRVTWKQAVAQPERPLRRLRQADSPINPLSGR